MRRSILHTRREVLLGGVAALATLRSASATLLVDGILAADAVACDSYWANCVLLLPFEDVNHSIGAPGFTDQSIAAHGTGTVSGTTEITTTDKVFGVSSAFFTTVPSSTLSFPSSADWQFGAGLFTIEGWVKPINDFGTGTIIAQWVGAGNQLSWLLAHSVNIAGGDFKLHWIVSTTGANIFNDITSPASMFANIWYAWAIDYDGIKYRMYIDGVMVGSSATPRTLFAANAPLTFGTSNGGGNGAANYQDEVRITKGVARYASDGGYTVATSAFPTTSCL